MRKTVTAAALAASLTIGGAAGAVVFVPSLSGAQTDDPTETTEDDAGRAGFLIDALAPLVEDGTLTQDQVDAVVAVLRDARPDRGHHHRMHQRLPFSAALTEELDISAADLRAALADGQTIAEIAEERSVAVDDLIDAVVSEAQERLDDAVAAGRLTQAEADEKLAAITEHVTALVDGDAPADDTTGS